MSLSSWLGFGRKKSATDSESPSGSKPDVQHDTDDFIMIEGTSGRQNPMYPDLGTLGPNSLPYQVQPYPRGPQDNASPNKEHVSVIPSNPLEDVPFKLSSKLDINSCGWTASDVAHFKSLLARAVNLNETVFKYDFSNEESVIKEENQTARHIG